VAGEEVALPLRDTVEGEVSGAPDGDAGGCQEEEERSNGRRFSWRGANTWCTDWKVDGDSANGAAEC
jgi:hypothetical protein